MRIRSWRAKMNLNQEEAAKLLFMDVRTLQRKDRLINDCPKLLAIMDYQEIMTQPNIDKATRVFRQKYRNKIIKGDHWE